MFMLEIDPKKDLKAIVEQMDKGEEHFEEWCKQQSPEMQLKIKVLKKACMVYYSMKGGE